MAILDGDMILADKVADTTVADHASDVFDFGAAHAGYNQKVIILVNATSTSGGAATEVFKIQTDSNEAFSSPTELWASATLAYSDVTAGKRIVEFTLPWEVEQYVRVLHTIGTAALTAGKYIAYIDSARQTNGV